VDDSPRFDVLDCDLILDVELALMRAYLPLLLFAMSTLPIDCCGLGRTISEVLFLFFTPPISTAVFSAASTNDGDDCFVDIELLALNGLIPIEPLPSPLLTPLLEVLAKDDCRWEVTRFD
jgi:hypothetical protein